ncbi:MAG: hypothetical protein OSB47_12240 [Pirellulaceae bacterium]|nr:hypothetical protein [Pirellulaceae bacterium]
MKQQLILPLLLLAVPATAAEPATLKFETYSGYFVSNKFEPQATASFVTARTQKQFDQVFGVAFVMGDKSHRLAPDAFKSQLVLATIKRGMAFCTYQVTTVTEKNGVVQLRYKTTAKKSESASFSCPLIISVPQGKYRAIEFHENNKLVKRLTIKKS